MSSNRAVLQIGLAWWSPCDVRRCGTCTTGSRGAAGTRSPWPPLPSSGRPEGVRYLQTADAMLARHSSPLLRCSLPQSGPPIPCPPPPPSLKQFNKEAFAVLTRQTWEVPLGVTFHSVFVTKTNTWWGKKGQVCTQFHTDRLTRNALSFPGTSVVFTSIDQKFHVQSGYNKQNSGNAHFPPRLGLHSVPRWRTRARLHTTDCLPALHCPASARRQRGTLSVQRAMAGSNRPAAWPHSAALVACRVAC